MKSYIKYYSIVLVLLMIAGCNKYKDFGDTNINPNATEVASTEALLTNALINLGSIASDTRGGLYAQQISETQYTEVSLYARPVLDFSALYNGPLMDLEKVIQFNTDPETAVTAAKFGLNANQIAISRIAKAYIFWTITDRWGDIPYTEALKGADLIYPAYSDQKDIYEGLIAELTEAVDQLDLASNNVSGDIIANGNAASWARFGNSLRILIALRTSNVYPAASGWAAQELKKAFEHPRGYIQTNAQAMRQAYPGDVINFSNPYWQLYRTRSDFAESTLMVDLLTDLGDPRIQVYGSNTAGFPYGLTRDLAIDFTNSLGGPYAMIYAASLREPTTPVVIISASSVALAIAEAAALGWISEDAEEWYKTGIELGWEQYNVTGDIDTYITNAATLGLDLTENIQLQQYIAYYGNGIQAWSNWRRTGIPELIPTPYATNPGGQIPKRYVYPPGEFNLNETNVRAAAAKYDDNSPDARLWWDL